MTIDRRPYTGPADQAAMAGLVNAHPADHLHVVDLPYRLCSWAFDDPANARLWVDDHERVVGWAVMQTPFWCIDMVCTPELAPEVEPQILARADARVEQLAGTAFGRPMWFVNVFADQQGTIRNLEAAGFASQADVGENSWRKVLMRCAAPNLDAGIAGLDRFVIRPLAGAAEIPAYVALHQTVFESKSMTIPWRARTLQHAAHNANLDLVAVTQEGRLAGFCVGWLQQTADGGRGQIEPMGVHPAFRGLGLGRALLVEALQRLFALGAAEILVETDNYRDAAFALYESVGFRVWRDVLVFRKDYANNT